jgi:hypothetical protein
MATGTQTLVRLDGPRLLDADGALIAELGDDGHWRDPDGLPTTALTVPAIRAVAHVDPTARTAAQQDADRAWLTAAVATIAQRAGHIEPTATTSIGAVDQPRPARPGVAIASSRAGSAVMALNGQPVTALQHARILQLRERFGDPSEIVFTVERDAPHHDHVFACFYASDGQLLVEAIVDADGVDGLDERRVPPSRRPALPQGSHAARAVRVGTGAAPGGAPRRDTEGHAPPSSRRPRTGAATARRRTRHDGQARRPHGRRAGH